MQKASFRPAKASAAKKVAVARPVSCSAQKEAGKQMGSAVAAAALAVAFGFGQVDAAYADVAGLTPCSESKAFAKREKNELKGLQKRLKQVCFRRWGQQLQPMPTPITTCSGMGSTYWHWIFWTGFCGDWLTSRGGLFVDILYYLMLVARFSRSGVYARWVVGFWRFLVSPL